jgi:fucose 4-O-acetylase-like acetyltransferase
MSANQTRFLWLDIAKGWGSFLVVCGHVMLGLEGAGLLEHGTTWYSTLYHAKYLFNMPLFFVIAGLTVESSLRKGKQTFLLDKLHSLVYPFFLWSFVVVFLQSRAGSSINNPKSLAALQSIWYDPPSPFWMLYSLLLCHLVAAAFPERGRSTNLLLLSSGGLVLLFSADWFLSIPLAKENLVCRTLYHAWFYAVGIKCREMLMNVAGGVGRIAFSFAVFASLAMLCLATTEDHTVFHAASLPAAVAGIAFLVLFAKTIRGPVAEAWGALGRASMSIYVMHVIVGAAVRVVLLKLGVTHPTIHFLVGVSLAISLPYQLHAMLRHWQLLPALGLARLKLSDKSRNLPQTNATLDKRLGNTGIWENILRLAHRWPHAEPTASSAQSRS